MFSAATIASASTTLAQDVRSSVTVRDRNGNADEAVLEIRCRKIRVLPPVEKQKRYPALTLIVIHAEERVAPKNSKKVEWKLTTYLLVGFRADAIEKLERYALRWKIEVFHKILKSGCKAEDGLACGELWCLRARRRGPRPRGCGGDQHW